MLKIERCDAVMLLTLNRPEKRNALHPEMMRGLLTVLETIASDETLIAVVLTGAGNSFCAGLDLEQILSVPVENKQENLNQVFDVFQKIYTLPQPVIAAINGPAIAGGFDLAQFCDLRLCVPSAVFGQAEINLGLTQMMYPLYKTIGLSRAKELAMTGEVISAAEAYRIGFINHIYPVEEMLGEALKLAEKLATKPRQALFATKRLSRELIEMDSATAFKTMGAAIQESLNSEEHRLTLEKFLPTFKGSQKSKL